MTRPPHLCTCGKIVAHGTRCACQIASARARNKCNAPATVVDHIIPHRGDEALFNDRNNLQSLCAPCHNRRKQRLERAT